MLETELFPPIDIPESRSVRVLCVDDNRDSREMIKALLCNDDDAYDVTTVETGAEALELIAKEPFDLYVLDVWLPSMDGVGLCRRIREMIGLFG